MPSTDLDLYDVVDGVLVDDFGPCQQQPMRYCPGGLAPFVPDPYDADCGNTHRLTYLHPVCAAQLNADT